MKENETGGAFVTYADWLGLAGGGGELVMRPPRAAKSKEPQNGQQNK
jgi:hypothetical protein